MNLQEITKTILNIEQILEFNNIQDRDLLKLILKSLYKDLVVEINNKE